MDFIGGEKRKTPRINFQTPVKICKESTPDQEIQGEIINISPGGLSFYLPADEDGFQEKDRVICSFMFPLLGSVTKQGEVCYTRFGVNNQLKRIRIYGIKFHDLDLKIWSIMKKHINSGKDRFNAAVTAPDRDIAPDKRRDLRVIADLTGLLRSNGIQDIICVVNDVSYTGAKISTFVQIPQKMELNLELTFGADILEIPLKVVWSLPETLSSGQKIYNHGLVFKPLPPEKLETLKKMVQRIGGFK
ncbi:MAG: PilZ domain-containing protein [Bacillota bacterium]